MLTVDYSAGKLYVELPELEEEAISALVAPLVSWSKVRGKTRITAAPIALAFREIREAIPTVKAGASLAQYHKDRAALVEATPTLDPVLLPLEPGAVKAGNHLLPVQVAPTNTLISRSKAIVTATPGLGKTVITCVALLHRSPRQIVIVAPKSLLDTWAAEVEKWYAAPMRADDGRVTVKVWHTIQEAKKEPVDVLITSLNVISCMMVKGIAGDYFEAIDKAHSYLVLDESFSYKSRKSQRSKSLQAFALYFPNIWLLSGMPVSRYNDDLYMQLKILYPATFRSYWAFANRYCIVEKTPWGDKIIGDKPGGIERLKKDLQDVLIECDYPEEVPDWIPEIVECPLSPRQAAIYLDLRDELRVEAETLGAEEPLTVTALIALTSGLLQAASNPLLLDGEDCGSKWDKLEERLQSDPLPALVWVQYIKTAERLLERLSKLPGMKVALLTGKTPVESRSPIVKAFQDGELNLLILHPGVGKYGFTLTAAKTAYYLEKSYNAEEFYQTLYRARRIVSTHPVRVVHLLAALPDGEPTIDHIVQKVLTNRSHNAMLLTVGDLIGSL